MTTHILGLDIAKDKFDCVLLIDSAPHRRSFRNSLVGWKDLERWLHRLGVEQVHACMEATGRLWEGVALHLQKGGHRVSVVNPVRIKRYSQSRLSRNKTDDVDALLITLFCREQNPPLWTPPSPAQRRLQELTRLLLARKGQLQQERNRLKSGVQDTVVCREIRALIKNLTAAIRRLETEINAIVCADPQLQKNSQLLCSIPGVSGRTAAVVLAELPEPKNFKNASQAAAYAGLTPAQNQSGSSIRGKTRLCKTGNRHLRQALYFPAIVASLHNPLLKTRAERLRAAGKNKMCVIGAVMHHLLRQVFAILKHQQPFNPNLHAPCQAA
jgi:transposase